MRKLTQREKFLFAIVAVVGVVVLFMMIVPVVRQRFSGGTLETKRNQLQTAQELVSLAQITESIEGQIRNQAGLQGQIISDSLFTEISDKVRLEQLNEARQAPELAALHPALKEKAETLLAYRKQRGQFESLNELRKVQGPLFEGEQPQAVISRQISEFAQKAGLRPNYQLSIKPMSGKKSEKISPQAKKNLALYLYMSQLDEELKQLQVEDSRNGAEQNTKQTEAEAVLDAIYDVWLGDDKAAADNNEKEALKLASKAVEKSDTTVEPKDAQKTPSKPKLSKAKSPLNPPFDKGGKGGISDQEGQFAQFPEVIPLAVRIQLIQLIQSNLKLQLAGAAEFKKGFLEEQVTVVNGEAKRGFLGIGSKKQQPQARFAPGSILLAKFEELMNRSKSEQADDMPEGKGGNTLDVAGQRNALANYIDQILKQKEKFNGWFAKVPSTHQPEEYIVEMTFKGEIDKVVKLVQSIEASLKWLSVRGLRISIADKNQVLLNAELSMVAKIL
jgi:hypothetical protein